MSLVIHDVEQGSQEWLNLRLGIITASNASKLMVNGKSKEHSLGVGALEYLDEKIAESYTGLSQSTFHGNQHTERGHALEPLIAEYYIDSGYSNGEPVTVTGIGINQGVGASPDRLVGDNGGLEIKSMLGKKVVELFRCGASKIDKDHIAQCQCNMWVWEREWWDYMVLAEGLPPFIHRFERDEKFIKKLSERVNEFYKLKADVMNIIVGSEM